MGVFSFVKAGKKAFDTIKSVKPNVPDTKIGKKIRDLKIETQKLKGARQKIRIKQRLEIKINFLLL